MGFIAAESWSVLLSAASVGLVAVGEPVFLVFFSVRLPHVWKLTCPGDPTRMLSTGVHLVKN